MEQDHQPKKQNSKAVSILIFVSVCILSNFAFIMYQNGAFHFWKSLPHPPSPAIHIVNANPDGVWVKSADGNIYVATVGSIVTAPVPCVSGDTCPRWMLVKDTNDFHPVFSEYTVRETSCEKFDGQFPRNPSGIVIECVKTLLPAMPEGGGFDSYFALMSDGTIKHWVKYNGVFFTPIANTIVINAVIASLICPTIALLMVTTLSKFRAKAG